MPTSLPDSSSPRWWDDRCRAATVKGRNGILVEPGERAYRGELRGGWGLVGGFGRLD